MNDARLTNRGLIQLGALVAARATPDAVYTVVPQLIARLRAHAAEVLKYFIEELSVEYLKQPWEPGFEFQLWQALREGAERIAPFALLNLRDLSEEAGGWYYVDPETGAKTFEPLAVWIPRFTAWKTRPASLEAENAALKQKIAELEAELSRHDAPEFHPLESEDGEEHE